MKKVLLGIAATVLSIAAIIGIAWGTGYLKVGYTQTVGNEQQNAETKVFHGTQAYVDGAVSDISARKLEYDQSKDKTAREAIINYVRANYSNLDSGKIENSTISKWLQEIQKGTIQ